ncbi:bifunctional 3-phenylpropionate/cinnamic acid dioxygenase ferredoxin subunit [Sporichthya brevicatena]|uniref:Bifunctional 3-phenylpropionate/cinnamic acid dioxygenase ferredoxin subunit n=1 Tax=Sporichthya brevicatena TaxID=171442 RepID=A0ABN1GBQ5_9ACTN
MTKIRACRVSDLPDGSCLRVECDPPLAVYRVGGEFFATADTCTHEEWSLAEDGEMDGYEVICCLHLARFDVRTGEATALPATVGLETYPVEVSGDDVWIKYGD